MIIRQISVFLENKAGRLAKVAEELKNNGINIRTLTIADTSDFGILRMIVSDPALAYEVLKKAGFTVKESGILAIEIDDRKGVFYDVMKLCDENDLNVEYTYSFVEQYSTKAIIFLRFEDNEKAAGIFSSKGYKLLTDDEIRKI
jgi:hypothetical protein